jgi:hypothetical protein
MAKENRIMMTNWENIFDLKQRASIEKKQRSPELAVFEGKWHR